MSDAPKRPSLGASMRTSSFLKEHQQYRPPANRLPETHYGIDAVVEDFHLHSPTRAAARSTSPSQSTVPAPAISSSSSTSSTTSKPAQTFHGLPNTAEAPLITKGATHSLNHHTCVTTSGTKSNRMIATLFYKSTANLHRTTAPSSPLNTSFAAFTNAHDSKTTGSSSIIASPQDEANANTSPVASEDLGPATSLDSFPLEPPTTAGLDQLDHLYGTYISPLCMAAFLHLMSSFPLPPDAEGNVHSTHRCLDDREHPRVVEFTLSPAPLLDNLSLSDLRKHELIHNFEREWNVDVVLQEDTVTRRYPRLVVFDMDSTLITQEVIDLMADTIKDPPDIGRKVADITHRAMQGELEFGEAFRERLQLLKGLPSSIFADLRSHLDVTNGVPELLAVLKRLGVKTAVLSGGFMPLTQSLASSLGIDYAYANNVIFDPVTQTLTGEVDGLIVDKERKRDLLVQIAQREGISLRQTVAVGDGSNDLLMLAEASLGVAWHAKPKVQMEADARLNGESMLDLLYLFGFSREEVEDLRQSD